MRALLTRSLGVLPAVIALTVCGCAQLQESGLGSIFGSGKLDEQTVGAGLKDALRVGTDRTADATSKVDGFLGNAAIRIAMPKDLDTMAGALRTVGLGAEVDSLEVGMNRAAEKASAEARPVFWDAVTQMTLADAYGILNGGKTAATDYFRAQTSNALRRRFRPVVAAKLGEVGLYKTYNALVSRYMALPLVSKPSFDLDGYVTEKALDGLFTVLAQEETRIREDPAARTTDLLKRVFGQEQGSGETAS